VSRAEVYAREMVARTAPPTVEQVAAALAELGDTPDAIADRLRALEIKGKRGAACQCPIAAYLRFRFGVRAIVGAGMQDVITWRARTGWPEIPTPLPVAAFALNFDRGVYLDLVLAEAAAR
jgi:hypothetical protein